MSTEHLPLEFKFASQDDGVTFEGLASTYGRDLHGDIVAPGAFTKTLAEHKAAGTRPALLWSHDPSEPIGVIESLEEAPDGLRIKGRLADTARARDARALAKMGALGGLSIGFRTRKASTGPEGARVIEDLQLFEISFVATPANPGARLATIKAADAAERADAPMSTNITGAAPDLAVIETKLAALAAEVKSANDRADALETALARPAIVTKSEDLTAEQKAFNSFMAKGKEALTADEVKDLRVADDSQGGYLAPQQFVAELIRNIVLFSPVRQAARIGSTAAGSVVLPRRTGKMTASWVGETEDRPETQPAYGSIEIPVHEIACYVDVSNKLLEDSAVNLESELAFDFGEEFGRIEGAAFLNGDGIKKPLGLLQTPGIATVKSGNGTGLAASNAFDTVMDLYHALPSPYAGSAVWGANRTTIGTLRKLKDAQGRYLWADPVAQGQPATILGRPVVEMPDLPDIAAGTKPVVFGDFSNFRIYDRVALSLLRNPYTLADKGLVRFHARRRVGAGVTRTEAFRFLEIGV